MNEEQMNVAPGEGTNSVKGEPKPRRFGRTLWDFLTELLDIHFWKVFSYLVALVLLSIPTLLVYQKFFPNLVLFNPPPSIQESEYLLYLPASVLWLNTGIAVAAGDSLEIRAVGSVHLAVHHLVWHAIADINKPQNRWLSYPMVPGGFVDPEGMDSFRKVKGALSEESLGTILLHVGPTTGGPSAANPHINQKDIMPIRPGYTFNYTTLISVPHDGVLYMTVNDVIPTKEIYTSEEGATFQSRFDKLKSIEASFREGQQFRPADRGDVRQLMQYLCLFAGSLPKDASNLAEQISERWEQLDAGYRNQLWFEDNCGGYLVHIRFARKQ